MRWIKHFTDNHRGKSVQYLLDELGYFGPFFKDTILEMCAEKLVQFQDRELTEDDCRFTFHRRVVESATRAKRSTVHRALVGGQSANFWTFTEDGEYFHIFAPILLDLLEYDQKKSRARRAQIAPGSRLEKSRVDKSREEKNKGANVTVLDPQSRKPKAPAPEGTQRAISRYCEAWQSRYGTSPPIGQKVAGQIKNLVKDHGLPQTLRFIEAYLEMPDQWFVTKRHDIPTLLGNLNAITQFIETGRMITKRDVANLDSSNSLRNTLEAIERGEI